MTAFPRNLFRDIFIVVLISAIYLLAAGMLLEFKNEQFVLAAIFATCYLASSTSRKFILGFSIFILYAVIFDFMKIFPNYLFSPVHIESLYQTEKFFFGINTAEGRVTLNEFFLLHHYKFLDFFAGAFYLCWIPIPLLLAFYLYAKKREQFLYFALNFIVINLIGWTIYYTFPAAPPWYMHDFGNVFHAHTPGNIAGLKRFDDLVGIPIFYDLYTKSSNVFAAMPSLHSAYPLIVFYYGVKNNLGFVNVFFGIISIGIWFAAIYTSHHYTVDVLAGISVTILGISIFELVLKKNRYFNNLFNTYLKKIS